MLLWGGGGVIGGGIIGGGVIGGRGRYRGEGALIPTVLEEMHSSSWGLEEETNSGSIPHLSALSC